MCVYIKPLSNCIRDPKQHTVIFSTNTYTSYRHPHSTIHVIHSDLYAFALAMVMAGFYFTFDSVYFSALLFFLLLQWTLLEREKHRTTTPITYVTEY